MCKFCGKEFVNNKILMKHIIVNHEVQQMAFLASTLNAQEKSDEDDPDVLVKEEVVVEKKENQLGQPVLKAAPKLLQPGFFHPTLKKPTGNSKPIIARKVIVIKNGFKDQQSSFNNMDKIGTQNGHNKMTLHTQNYKSSGLGIYQEHVGLDITASLDKMLEEFEEEEKEEERRSSQEKEDVTESVQAQKAVNEEPPELSDIEVTSVPRSPPSEADYLESRVEDAIMEEEEGGEKNKMLIVKDSEIVGQVRTSVILENMSTSNDPFREKLVESVSIQYNRFWSNLGLTPKLKKGMAKNGPGRQDPKARKKNEKHGSVAKKFCSPNKNICVKKFASEANIGCFKRKLDLGDELEDLETKCLIFDNLPDIEIKKGKSDTKETKKTSNEQETCPIPLKEKTKLKTPRRGRGKGNNFLNTLTPDRSKSEDDVHQTPKSGRGKRKEVHDFADPKLSKDHEVNHDCSPNKTIGVKQFASASKIGCLKRKLDLDDELEEQNRTEETENCPIASKPKPLAAEDAKVARIIRRKRPPPESLPENDPEIGAAEVHTKCRICDKNFTSLDALLGHLTQVHN